MSVAWALCDAMRGGHDDIRSDEDRGAGGVADRVLNATDTGNARGVRLRRENGQYQ